jgi:hypothetical protein
MRILVTEHSDHFSLLSHLDNVLEKQYDVEFVFRMTEKQEYWKFIFNSKRRVKTFGHPNRLSRELGFFFYILFHGCKVDRIIINTGPEYESGKIVFLSLLAYMPHKRKLTYIVRNPSQSAPGLKIRTLVHLLRSLLLKNAASLIFENVAVEKETLRLFPKCLSKPRCILYTSFLGDIHDANVDNGETDEFVIGILGAISPERRDYEEVIQALRSLDTEAQDRIRIIFLGSIAHPSSADIINSFREIVKVETVNEVWLSDDAFISLGSGCHIFLAPLKFGLKKYGTGGSTGSFGDAIRFKKKLIIPRFADPLTEFSLICTYYEDAVSLSVALNGHFVNREQLEVTEQLAEKFGKSKIMQDLQDLITR